MYYRKQPVIVKAIMWTGNNLDELCREFENFEDHYLYTDTGYLYILTLEGMMKASYGDYIIRGVDGEFYPCKNDIFLKTYEMVSKEDMHND